MQKIADERRQDKLEEKLARERVRAQIEQDKIDKKAREALKRGEASISSSNIPTAQPTAVSVTQTCNRQYTETRLQIRQIDGKKLLQTFDVNEPLAAVRLYVQL